MERQLRFIIHENLQRLKVEMLRGAGSEKIGLTDICHELFASSPDILRQCRTEHHYLLVVGRCSENFLDVAAHV